MINKLKNKLFNFYLFFKSCSRKMNFKQFCIFTTGSIVMILCSIFIVNYVIFLTYAFAFLIADTMPDKTFVSITLVYICFMLLLFLPIVILICIMFMLYRCLRE